ncbi:regulatory protein [Azorhizobium caulinodans ORS 571]|uniref:Regulatory protein n=1 Tax=Azorhizobium caulinodans (strain ATCC 43989 / DSM 5975 / JCM 20966 / LMG 6465 / NBRC 14845 / NCIMB 13405 / ORS 571) TaxID=438753 RepID=A8IHZ4_AZOC5|nr:GntR family transcriptional regulator [Azorhizobium caulinodans]BAF89339.1 regulatory protein [Azorhizobium caulinodans ORS 571]
MPAEPAFARWTEGLEATGLAKRVRAIPASARIHAALREQIIGMEIAPGSALQEKQIALACGVSRTPVREALLKLADERLVDIFPQYGTFVSRISVPAMHDAMVIRDALERAAVRGAAIAATDAAIARLRNILTEQRTTHEAGHLTAFHAADETFHQAIAEIAGHPNLWRVVRQEKAHVDRCRILSLPSPSRRIDVMADHEAIFEGIASRDPDKAEAAMRAHLDQVLPSVGMLVKAHPGYFEGVDQAPVAPVHADGTPVQPAPVNGTTSAPKANGTRTRRVKAEAVLAVADAELKASRQTTRKTSSKTPRERTR